MIIDSLLAIALNRRLNSKYIDDYLYYIFYTISLGYLDKFRVYYKVVHDFETL